MSINHAQPAAGVGVNQTSDDDDDEIYIWDNTKNVEQNKVITRIRVDDAVKVLPWCAFSGCTNLREIQLSPGMTVLGGLCFFQCSSLKTIDLPDCLQYFDEAVFQNSGLEQIQIPPEIVEIEDNVFEDCKSLVYVNMHDSITRIGRYSFFNCKKLKTIRFPPSLKDIRPYAFLSSGLEQIQLPTTVHLRQNAFQDCRQLNKIILPPSIGIVAPDVFLGCHNVCELHLSTNNTDGRWGQRSFMTAAEQKLLTVLCVTGSAIDHLAMDWKAGEGYEVVKEPTSTVQTTCLFSFLNINIRRILKNAKQA